MDTKKPVLTAREISLMTNRPHAEVLGVMKMGGMESFRVGRSWSTFRTTFEKWAEKQGIPFKELSKSPKTEEIAAVE